MIMATLNIERTQVHIMISFLCNYSVSTLYVV